jgi:hypothetical protein
MTYLEPEPGQTYRLRIQQNAAVPPAPAQQHWLAACEHSTDKTNARGALLVF